MSNPDTPAARVLAALGAAKEGLTFSDMLDITVADVRPYDFRVAMDRLVADGAIWKVRRLYPDGSGEWRYYSRSDALRRDREPSGAWR